MKIAKIRVNESKGPWLHWDYIVDVYEVNGTERKLDSRSYTNSITLAVEIVEALADAIEDPDNVYNPVGG